MHRHAVRCALGVLLFCFSLQVKAGGTWDEEDFQPSGFVTELTAANFATAVDSMRPVLVDFYAPWCGHCKHLAPAYDRAAEMLHAAAEPKVSKIKLAKIDATAAADVAKEYGVTGYPTLVLFSGDGSLKMHRNLKQLGPANDAYIANWLARELAGDRALMPMLQTHEEVENFRKLAETTVVVFADAEKSAGLIKEMKSVAQRLSDEVPGILVAQAPLALSSAYAAAAVPAVVTFSASVGAHPAVLAQQALAKAVVKAEKLTEFILKHDVPEELRNGAFLSPWMKNVLLLGTSKQGEHSDTARHIFDYAAKGVGIRFDDQVIQTRPAKIWLLKAAKAGGTFLESIMGGSDIPPTAVMLEISKGRVVSAAAYGRGLAPREGETLDAALDALTVWAAEYQRAEFVSGTGPKIDPNHLQQLQNMKRQAAGENPRLSAKTTGYGGVKHKHIPEHEEDTTLLSEDEKMKREQKAHESLTVAKKKAAKFAAKQKLASLAEKNAAETKKAKEKSYNLLTATKPRSLGTGVDYVALIDMCTTVARPEGVTKAEGGKHAAHKGLEDFMNNRGIWYVNSLRAPDMSYSKACGGSNKPHIRVVEGGFVRAVTDEHGRLSVSMEELEALVDIPTDNMTEAEIVAKLEEFDIKVPVMPKQEM